MLVEVEPVQMGNYQPTIVATGTVQPARQDYALLGDTLSREREALVLRKPQLNAVKARLKAAEAAVDQARLNLERTAIRAPFDAQLLGRNANVGAQVGPGDSLGQLIGTDKYWVTVAVPTAQLKWLDFPKTARQRGAPVKLTSPNAWPEGAYRTGYLFKLLGTLEGNTRMARAIVEVPDPLALQPKNTGKPRLMVGAFLEAHLEGEALDSVVRLNRDLLREDETVWVMQKDSLDIREVEVVLKDSEYAYIRSGLEAGEQVVQTNLSTVVEGAALRLPEASAADSSITSTDSRTTKEVQ
jgi:RND family efflux transporter MFP subunit